jgi:cardiolipin synthase
MNIYFVSTFSILIQLTFTIRVILRPHRQPASRIAWIVVIAAIPFIGSFIYILFGELNIGKKRRAKNKKVIENFPELLIPSDWFRQYG